MANKDTYINYMLQWAELINMTSARQAAQRRKLININDVYAPAH